MRAWHVLQEINPVLNSYQRPQITEELVRYFVTHKMHKRQMREHGWENNYLLPAHDLPPNAFGHRNQFRHLALGTDGQKQTNYSHPDLLPLLFPWLYPYGKGHWNFTGHENHDSQFPSVQDTQSTKRLTIKEYGRK